jgi:hypothetical protein
MDEWIWDSRKALDGVGLHGTSGLTAVADGKAMSWIRHVDHAPAQSVKDSNPVPQTTVGLSGSRILRHVHFSVHVQTEGLLEATVALFDYGRPVHGHRYGWVAV